MKKALFFFLFLLATVIHAQTIDKNQKWVRINTGLQKGEYKSLLPQVDSIYAQACKDGDKPEIVKALLCQSQILAATKETADDNGYKIAIDRFQAAIPLFEGATRSVLQSLLAHIYQQYEQNTRWQRSNITELDSLPPNTAEWASNQLLQRSIDLYLQSISEPSLLQLEKTENWKQLLYFTDNIALYPTLYDVLMVRCINATKSNSLWKTLLQERDEEPNYNDAFYERKDIEFIRIPESFYQTLIDFHRNEQDKSAYLNFRLIQIEAGLNTPIDLPEGADNSLNSTEAAILSLADDYKAEPFAAYLYYRAAWHYKEKGNKRRAVEICRQVKRDAANKWSVNAASLLQELKLKRTHINMDEFNLPNKPIAVKVSATNTHVVHYNIYKCHQYIDKDGSLNENQEESPYRQGAWTLKEFDDYAEHNTTVKLDALPQGYYCIEIGIKENKDSLASPPSEDLPIVGFGSSSSPLSFYVDEWTTINLEGAYQVLNRRTGKPVANKSLKVHNNSDEKTFTLRTDKNGIIKLPLSEEEEYDYDNDYYLYNPEAKTYIEFPKGYSYSSKERKQTETELALFLDRAIYRPGQTVYFKGILYSKQKNEAAIVKNKTLTVYLKNPNDRKVSELQLTTNDYGSVFGELVLPQGGLTGTYTLRCNEDDSDDYYIDGYKSFKVEEYKRPKFGVDFDEFKGEFTLGNKVTTTGKAESFAGAPISEAKVIYRVERRAVFPYYRMWWQPEPAAPNETILQGEGMTDNTGKFEITFKALPKDAQKSGQYRTYAYTVYADVTDINGETHSAQQRVTVGDLPRMLSLQLPQRALQKDFTNVIVKSTNLNGVREESKGIVTVTQLISPDRILLPNKVNNLSYRYYDYNSTAESNYQLYDKQTFVKYFPHLPYTNDEMRPETWKEGKTYHFDFDTDLSDTLVLSQSLSKGYYRVEAYTLYGNDTIRTAQTVEILDNKTLTPTNNNFYSMQMDKQSYQVGDRITLSFLSNWKDAVAIVHIKSDQKWIDHRKVAIKNGKGILTLTATEQFLRNGLFISSYLLHENGYEQNNQSIFITDKPHKLKITTKTFRNKIRPGEQETWELTISGTDKDKVAAEVLATMYDASLDEFASNSFFFNPFAYSPNGGMYYYATFRNYDSNNTFAYFGHYMSTYRTTDLSNLIDFTTVSGVLRQTLTGAVASVSIPMEKNVIIRGLATTDSEKPLYLVDGVPVDDISKIQTADISEIDVLKDASATAIYGARAANGIVMITTKNSIRQQAVAQEIQVRKNLQETAFFYPNLYTDENGNVKLTFTSPEALTKWKLLILAHTQNLHSTTAELYTQTQKELMVVPNVPRFVREGDEVVIAAKINNLSNKNLTGNVQLFIYNALNDELLMDDADIYQRFDLEGNKNCERSWNVKIPKGVQAIKYVVSAYTQLGSFEDGEQGILPVLPNRMLVTETMPIFAKEGQTKTFEMKKLTNNSSTTLQNFNLTAEFTTHPLWVAVMSLPYLREYPYACSEQLFSRLYGNVLSTHIVKSNPKIKAMFDRWNHTEHNVSALEQNQELKNILLEETPWIRQAQSESEQHKRLGLLFNLNNMTQELTATQQKINQRQNTDGGFAWFEGGNSNPYITEHIIQGYGQLMKLTDVPQPALINKAISYIDTMQVAAITKAEKWAKEHQMKVDGKEFIHYYYVRSFWRDEYPLPEKAKKYLKDINKCIPAYFMNYDLQRKAMIATTLHRYGYEASAQIIIKHLEETSVEADEMGMYWKDNRLGWYWYQSPVEAQTKVIEAFAEITPEDVNSIEEMKIWLMKNRQANSWNSTKATTDAIYALMNFGKDQTDSEDGIEVHVGKEELTATEDNSGYIKQSWKGNEITPDLGKVEVTKSSPGTMWGGLYWQYFDNLDKITQADSNVKMEKSLFLKRNTDEGQKLLPATTFNVGDLVTIRLVITVDREMEYIHLKDMRAAGFEPINVLSGYNYQNGCSYYESTCDATTNFFFERMTKGIYVFEYDVRANNAGIFSNGITMLQNMYAPEMSCHSAEITIEIKNNAK